VEEHQRRPASHAFIGDLESVDLDHVHDTRRDRSDQASFAQTPVNREHRAAARRLAVVIGVSVMSDAEAKVPTGGELTLFEAVGRWA
jgi:hypothetical protein